MTEYKDVVNFIKEAGRDDLYDLQDVVKNRIEARLNESRVELLQVRSTGMIIAHFRKNEMKSALEYCLKHVGELEDGNVDIDIVRCIESEVDERILDRWF